MDDSMLIAPCGLDCFNCVMFMALESPKLRRDLAGKLNLEPEEAQCRGCRQEEGRIAFLAMSEPCDVFACAEEKGMEFCNQCARFPCALLGAAASGQGDRSQRTSGYLRCLERRMSLGD